MHNFNVLNFLHFSLILHAGDGNRTRTQETLNGILRTDNRRLLYFYSLKNQ